MQLSQPMLEVESERLSSASQQHHMDAVWMLIFIEFPCVPVAAFVTCCLLPEKFKTNCSKRIRPLSSWKSESPYAHPRRYNLLPLRLLQW